MSDGQREARVAQYGLLPPITGDKLIRDQMRAVARYYNDLIALERVRRSVYRDLRGRHAGLGAFEERVSVLAGELDTLRLSIKVARQESRRRVRDQALDARTRTVHAQLREARSDLSAARLQARENLQLRSAANELDERAKVWAKGLRATTDAYWGSYLLAEASVQQARKASVDPEFRRARGRERVAREWNGSAEGRIGVQIQGGMTIQDLLLGDDTRLRLVDAPASFRGGRTSARGLRRCASKLLYVRVGSEARAPIWAVFPVVFHRDIPSDALIKGATVSLRVEGMRERWVVNFTYTREAAPLPQRGGVVALDLGWRKRPNSELRVAYWADDGGRHGEIAMPRSVTDRLHRARNLRAVQDEHFNRAIAWLRRWLRVNENVPTWLGREQSVLGQWRSHARLRDLVLRWRLARFAGDARIFAQLERWLHRSRHLSQYEDGDRAGALRHRREVYRLVAARLARTYGSVVVEDFDLAEAKRLHAPEQEEDAPAPQRAQLHAAAPGELRLAITQAVVRDGGVVAVLSAVGTTSQCHGCGGACSWNQGQEIWHTCEHCGAVWDQDHNAAINLLRTFVRERFGEQKGSAGSREPPKRAQRFAKRNASPVGSKSVAE